MPYLFKNRFSIAELASIDSAVQRIVLAEPEEYLRELYAQLLANNNFRIFHSSGSAALENEIRQFSPHLLIISSNFAGADSQLPPVLKKLKYGFPNLPVVTLGYNLDNEQLKALMSAGISSHIDRRLTRPADVVMVVKTILNN